MTSVYEAQWGHYQRTCASVALEDIAQRYVDDTERFDRTVCSGVKDGIAKPINASERAAVEGYARQRYTLAQTEAAVFAHERTTELRRIIARLETTLPPLQSRS